MADPLFYTGDHVDGTTPDDGFQQSLRMATSDLRRAGGHPFLGAPEPPPGRGRLRWGGRTAVSAVLRADGAAASGAAHASAHPYNCTDFRLRLLMTQSHDPLQFVKQFHQILAAAKLSLGFFFGAGCPCAVPVPTGNGTETVPLIGDIQYLTHTVSDVLTACDCTAAPFRTLLDILHADGIQGPNIETMLSRIRSLRDAAGAGDVRGLSAANLKALDLAISTTISKVVEKRLPAAPTPYHCVADFAGRFRTPPLEIFTTNYDLLTEQALESSLVPFFDGFVGAYQPFFDQQSIEDDSLPVRWTLLWKLHGSINWRFDKNTKVISRSVNPAHGEELLIHPSHLKYDESRRMPYLVMIDRLKTFIRNNKRPVALFVVGHSFADEHLNATLLEGLRANSSAACYAFQFCDLDHYPEAAKLAMTTPNLNILAPREAIIRKRRGRWRAGPATDLASLANAFELFTNAPDADSPDPLHAGNAASEDSRACRFLLGDFQHFGRFLQQIAAPAPASEA